MNTRREAHAELKPGRELDALMATTVLGWGWVGHSDSKWLAPLNTIGTVDADAPHLPAIRAALDTDEPERSWWLAHTPPNHDCEIVPHVSTDIAACFAYVVAAMRTHPDPAKRTLDLRVYPYNRTYATFSVGDELTWSEGNGEHATPLAICLAALAACDGTSLPPIPKET